MRYENWIIHVKQTIRKQSLAQYLSPDKGLTPDFDWKDCYDIGLTPAEAVTEFVQGLEN